MTSVGGLRYLFENYKRSGLTCRFSGMLREISTPLIASYLKRNLPSRLIRIRTMQMIRVEEVQRIITQAASDTMLERLDRSHTYYTLGGGSDDIEQFVGDAVKEHTKFAILSHRWGADEMTLPNFRELWNMTKKDSGSSESRMDTWLDLTMNTSTNVKNGQPLIQALNDSLLHLPDMEEIHITGPEEKFQSFRKLVKFCYLAHQEHGCDFAWIDTCCIDKISSAELDEAIRSMFRWYRNWSICITHLASTNKADIGSLNYDPWFRRGWTLQELLAPKFIKFYDRKWKPLSSEPNDKGEPDIFGETPKNPLMEKISQITSIPLSDLLNFKPGLNNVRNRLVWASKRETTRIEDKSYCLLGIFNLNMPIAYGEGEAAFHRLQAAIMEESNDRSLFLWEGKPSQKSSMLASSPVCFSESAYPQWQIVEDIRARRQGFNTPSTAQPNFDPTYTLTNHGLRITASLYSIEATRNWLEKAWDRPSGTADIFTLETFRFAILAYGSWCPPGFHLLPELSESGNYLRGAIVMLLAEKRFLKNIYYLRHPWKPRIIEIKDAPNNPETIFIR